MNEIMFDQRPLNPNKQYLQQKEQEHKKRKQIHTFLKKNQLQNKVLPCFRQKNIGHKQIEKQNNKTKAQIYQQIKQKNLQKFGQLLKQQKQQIKKVQKKIHPKDMTISYKPVISKFIDTKEYQLKGFKQIDTNEKNINKKQSIQLSAKQKYQKLLELMKKQKQQLNNQKQSFEQKKDFIQFKELIKNQNSLPFVNQIRNIMKKNKNSKHNKRTQSQQNKVKQSKSKKHIHQNRQQSETLGNQNKQKQINQVLPQFQLNELQHRIKNLVQQKQELEYDLINDKKINIFLYQQEVIYTKYSIEQINKIPSFQIECLKQFIDLKTVMPEGNQYYKTAIRIFESTLSSKENSNKLLNVAVLSNEPMQDNIEFHNQLIQDNIQNLINYKRKYDGKIRITKYHSGWIEVWSPGCQRLMANKHAQYKLVWLKNGDIKQQWKNNHIISYYSKAKAITKITYKQNQPIYFFNKLNQLQQHFPQKQSKVVMFKDGRVQTFHVDCIGKNYFAF